MDSLSDKRLFAMCLISAVAGLVAYGTYGSEYGGGLVLYVAIAVLAVLMFADGYVSSS